MDKKEYLWLVMKNLSGEITEEEKQRLAEFLKESAIEEEKHNLLKRFWTQEVFYNHSADTHQALEKVLQRINGQQEKEFKSKTHFISSFKKFAVAAILVVAVGLGIFSIQVLKQDKKAALIEKYNSIGSRSMVTLADGTRIWLNSDSKLKYPKEFNGDTREVYLTGEAFFKVARDTHKPFFIHLNNARIKVLGTSFNVKAYSNDEQIMTSVVSGKVAFITYFNSNSHTVFLTKNKKATFVKHSGELKTETANTTEDTEWIKGKLIFKSETLEEISKQLERTFGKKIFFKNQKLKLNKYTGTFDDTSLQEILTFLALSKAFQYSETDSTLTIY